METYVILQIPVKAKDPYRFSEGSFVRSVYSGEVYQIMGHSKNGMSKLLHLGTDVVESWNGYSNAHFIPADYVSLGVGSLLCPITV